MGRERQEVKQITKRWVMDNCTNVTERDMGMLKILANRRLLRRDHIQSLYPKFPSTDYLNKRLSILYNKHIIDRIYPPVGMGKGSSKQHICLDRAGIILLGMDKYNKPIQYDTEGNKSLFMGWKHRIALNDYECRIREYCNSHDLSIIKIESEKDHPYHNTKIIPDIFLFIKNNTKGHLFFIEVDLGTEDLPYVKDKMQGYVNYYMSKSWIREKWARVFKNPTYPQVIFLTEEGRNSRVKSIQDHVNSYSLKFHVGFHSELTKILNSIIKEDS